MEDIQTKLSELLGREVKQVRRTDEVPPRISIIDVAIAVMGKTQHDAAQDFRRLSDQYPEVGTNCSLYKFKGRRQRDTPVSDLRGVVEFVLLPPGNHAGGEERWPVPWRPHQETTSPRSWTAVLDLASMADVHQQLAALLGREVKQLRITDDDPPYISVVDVTAVINRQEPRCWRTRLPPHVGEVPRRQCKMH